MEKIMNTLNNEQFNESSAIHFSCTQCGGCCQKSPTVNIYDMLELSDEFIFQTSHHSLISFDKKPLEKEVLQHYQKIGHTIVMPELNAALFYWIDFISLNAPSYKTCSKLVDNKCSIYHKRPMTCQLAPLSYGYDEQNQWKPLQYFKNNTEKNSWKCDFTEKSPILFKNKEIVQTHQNSIYYNNLNTIRDFTDKFIEFLSFYGEERKDQHFKTLFMAHQKGSLMLTDLIQSLLVMKSCNAISTEYANKVVQNQIKLLENEINKSTIFKIKENLQYNRSYKKIKDDYIKALNNKIFDYNLDDNFSLVN